MLQVLPVTLPGAPALARLSVAEYHRMIEHGLLVGRRVELLEGLLVEKMTHHPPHTTAVQRTRKRIEALLAQGWDVRIQQPITLSTSESEPDVAVARGDDTAYAQRHPGPADLGLVVEVADTSLSLDRNDKLRLYARERIGTYWIVNLVDRQVEVYTDPSGPAATPGYGQRRDYAAGAVVPLVLDGVGYGDLAVADLLP